MRLSSGDILLHSGDSAGALGRYREALALAEAWNARQKSDARLLHELANCYEGLGRFYAAKAARSRRVEDWRDAFVWHQQNYDIWRAGRDRAPATVYSTKREERAAAAVAECERVLVTVAR